MNKLCKVPHKRKFHEAPCHKPDREKVIIIGNAIDSKKFNVGEVTKKLISLFSDLVEKN